MAKSMYVVIILLMEYICYLAQYELVQFKDDYIMKLLSLKDTWNLVNEIRLYQFDFYVQV